VSTNKSCEPQKQGFDRNFRAAKAPISNWSALPELLDSAGGDAVVVPRDSASSCSGLEPLIPALFVATPPCRQPVAT
jgi:hypothetical protein